jgi:hypothetical protein
MTRLYRLMPGRTIELLVMNPALAEGRISRKLD